jgi:hypothetical protein
VYLSCCQQGGARAETVVERVFVATFAVHGLFRKKEI